MILKHLRTACIFTVILVVVGTLSSVWRHRDKFPRIERPPVTDSYDYANGSRVEKALYAALGGVAPVALAEPAAPKPKFREQLKQTARSYGIPVPLVLATLSKEDAPWCKGTFCIKYEESYWNRCGHHKNNEMRRMCASSICQMQVMGKNAEALGHKPTDLFDEAVCVEVGVKMLADCWHKNERISSTKARVIAAGQCYNGARSYGEDLWPRVVRQAEGIDIS